MLGGVAAGLSDYFGVDPVVFRAAFVVLAFLGGIGIFLYLLGWLMIPPAPGREGAERGRLPSRLLGRVRGRPSWVGVILLVVGGALVAGRLGIWHPTVFWGVALLAMGIVLFREDRAWTEPGPASVERTAVDPILTREGSLGEAAASESSLQPFEGGEEARATLPPPPAARIGRWPFGPRQAAPSSPPRAPRERSALGWLVLGAALLAPGVGAVITETKIAHLHVSQILALPLTVVGAGLLVGAWRGRARWLILPGLALVPLVLLASLIDVPIRGGWGSRYFRPDSVAGIQRKYELTAGELVLDLSSLKFGPGRVPVSVTVAAGNVTILAPERISIDARGHAGAGRVFLLGLSERGIRLDANRTSSVQGSTTTLVLDLRTGIGEVSVYRVESESVPDVPPEPEPSPTDEGGG
jgi:phage shock protein PspC (stress-responsive transcriptional regulator)